MDTISVDTTEMAGGSGGYTAGVEGAMASFVAVSELQEHLTEWLARVEAGEEIFVQREGKPAVRLVADAEPLIKDGKRVGGQNLLGITYMAPDWDAPMTEEELAEWGI